jgi:hypothetical protein
MRLIQYDEALYPGSKIIADALATSLGGVSYPAGVQVLTTFDDDSKIRQSSVQLAVDYFAAKGSNPQTDLVGLADRIYKFIKGDA